ncbi:MAG: peptidase C25 [Thermoplasmata archaeon]|nr:MAG: peptidase C25 [Thermoplasmata archaeon]
MKNILVIFTIGLLIGSVFGAVAIAKENKIEKFEKIKFSAPTIKKIDKYVVVNFKEANSWMREPGKPVLPLYVKTLEFPWGTKIVNVECKPIKIKKIALSSKIISAPNPVPLAAIKTASLKVTLDKKVYESRAIYPDRWYTYTVGCGLDGEKRVFYLKITTSPLRYSPSENMLYYAEEMSVKTTCVLPNKKPTVFPGQYDLLIVAPSKFTSELQRLVDHKNNLGIKTKLVTIEDVYSSTTGRDGAEKLKYFIKQAIEDWNIKYVLLVGGKKSLLFGDWGMAGPGHENDRLWYIPVRYSNLDDQEEGGYVSDLYYADIYKYENGKAVFDDWDSNGDGVFAEWKSFKKDVLDLYPDVYVGRLPCRNKIEVKIMVDKIINYESTKADPSWFNKIILVAGDTFPDDYDTTRYYEGEIETWHGYQYVSDQFEAVKLYTSEGTFTGPEDVMNAIDQGSGFLYFAGHGSPTAWASHAPGSHEWVNGLMVYDMPKLSNGEKLPVCIVGGCHNSEFNISTFDWLKNRWTYGPTPECWSWWLTRKMGGGSIATIGNTGLGYGLIGDYNNNSIPDCIEGLGGWIESHFFQVYGEQGKTILGETWGTDITDYVNTFQCNKDQIDRKTVEEWVLIGDPTLQIGGYQ